MNSGWHPATDRGILGFVSAMLILRAFCFLARFAQIFPKKMLDLSILPPFVRRMSRAEVEPVEIGAKAQLRFRNLQE
jgi:hypothetical protein